MNREESDNLIEEVSYRVIVKKYLVQILDLLGEHPFFEQSIRAFTEAEVDAINELMREINEEGKAELRRRG